MYTVSTPTFCSKYVTQLPVIKLLVLHSHLHVRRGRSDLFDCSQPLLNMLGPALKGQCINVTIAT